MFHLGLPITLNDALSLAQKVDLFVMKYCNDVLTHQYQGDTVRLDPSAVLPKFKEARDQLDRVSDKLEEMFTVKGREAARQRSESDRPAARGQKEEGNVANRMLQLVGTAYRGCEATLLGSDDPATPGGAPAAGAGSGGKASGTPSRASLVVDAALKSESFGKMDEIGTKVEKRLERLFGGSKELEDVDPATLLPPVDKRLLTLPLASLCVRVRNLAWCKKQLEGLAEDVRILWARELQRREECGVLAEDRTDHAMAGQEEEGLGQLFLSSQMALDQGQSTLVQYIAHKVIFQDLRDDFVARLYCPSPRAVRLAHLLQQDGELDRVLMGIAVEFGSAEQSSIDDGALLLCVLEAVCAAVVKAMEWCIIGDHMGRIRREVAPGDATVVMEDVTTLKNYFVQRDEQGNAHGVAEVTVAQLTARLELVANTLLTEPSARLIELYYTRETPDDDKAEVVTRKNLVRALMRRPDREARDFVKEYVRRREKDRK